MNSTTCIIIAIIIIINHTIPTVHDLCDHFKQWMWEKTTSLGVRSWPLKQKLANRCSIHAVSEDTKQIPLQGLEDVSSTISSHWPIDHNKCFKYCNSSFCPPAAVCKPLSVNLWYQHTFSCTMKGSHKKGLWLNAYKTTLQLPQS